MNEKYRKEKNAGRDGNRKNNNKLMNVGDRKEKRKEKERKLWL